MHIREYSGTHLERPPFTSEKRSFKRVASHQGYKSIDLCLDSHCPVAFPEGMASHQGVLSKGVPLLLI